MAAPITASLGEPLTRFPRAVDVEQALAVNRTWVHIEVLPFTSRVTLGKLTEFSEPWFSPPYNRTDNTQPTHGLLED